MISQSPTPAPSRISTRTLVLSGCALFFAGMALRSPVEAQNAGAPNFAQAAPAPNPVAIKYRHKQVAMPIQPTLGKLDRPFVPDYEEEFKGWEVVTVSDLPHEAWPLNVKVPSDRRYRPIPNQKIDWMLYTLRQPVP